MHMEQAKTLKYNKKRLTLMMLQEKSTIVLATNPLSFIQNINDSRLWIWKKKYVLRNLVSHQPDADKTYLYTTSIQTKISIFD